jgi:hypothetical protein
MLSYGNLTLVKSVSAIICNLCSHSEAISEVRARRKKDEAKITSSQHLVMKSGLISTMMTAIETMCDYEVHVNIYTALGALLMSPHLEVR